MPIFLLVAGAALLGLWLQAAALGGPGGIQADADADALATPFVVYQRALAEAFVANGRTGLAVDAATGLPALPDSVLNLPPGYSTGGRWRNATLDGELYVWADNGTPQPPGFTDVVNSLGRHACVRRNDVDGVDCADGLRHLPAALAVQVPPGRTVSVGS